MHKGKIVGNEIKYCINELVANGAFSQVYICTSVLTGARYAVKIINRRLAEKHNMAAALIREVNAMEVMGTSPFVTSVIDKLISRHNYYIIMDLAEGGTLLDYLRQVRPVPCCGAGGCHCWVTLFFKQLLMALKTIHAHDIVHRDVKPENILLNKEHSRIKLTDFGFACYAPAGSQLYRACGTLKYCAPELLQEEPAYDGRKVDVWAAGVTLYVMLFNTYPYLPSTKHADPDAMLELMARTDYTVPAGVITAAMEDLLSHMLCKDPAARWSVEQLLEHPCLRDVNIEDVLPPPSSSATSGAGVDRVSSADAMAMPLAASSGTVFDDVDDGFYDRSSFARPPPEMRPHDRRRGAGGDRTATRSSLSAAKSLSVDEDIVGMTEPFLHAQALMVSIDSDSDDMPGRRHNPQKSQQQRRWQAQEDEEEELSDASGYASGTSGSEEEEGTGEDHSLPSFSRGSAEAPAGSRPRRSGERGGAGLGPAPSLGGRWRIFSVLGLFTIMTLRFLVSVLFSFVPIPAWLQPVVDLVVSPSAYAKGGRRNPNAATTSGSSTDNNSTMGTSRGRRQQSDLGLLAASQTSSHIVALRATRFSTTASDGSRIAASPSSLRSTPLFSIPSAMGSSESRTPVAGAPAGASSFPVADASPTVEKTEDADAPVEQAHRREEQQQKTPTPPPPTPQSLTESCGTKTHGSSLHEESNDVSHDNREEEVGGSGGDVACATTTAVHTTLPEVRLQSSQEELELTNTSLSSGSNSTSRQSSNHHSTDNLKEMQESTRDSVGSETHHHHHHHHHIVPDEPNQGSSSGTTGSPLTFRAASDTKAHADFSRRSDANTPTAGQRRRSSSNNSTSNVSSVAMTPYSPSMPLPRHPTGGIQAEDFPIVIGASEVQRSTC